MGQVGAVRHGEVAAAPFRFSINTRLHLRVVSSPHLNKSNSRTGSEVQPASVCMAEKRSHKYEHHNRMLVERIMKNDVRRAHASIPASIELLHLGILSGILYQVN